MLDMSDVDRVTWVCQQLDPAQLLAQEPLPLSQSVLLSLMQQLGSQLGKVGYSDRFTSIAGVIQAHPASGGCARSVSGTLRSCCPRLCRRLTCPGTRDMRNWLLPLRSPRKSW